MEIKGFIKDIKNTYKDMTITTSSLSIFQSFLVLTPTSLLPASLYTLPSTTWKSKINCVNKEEYCDAYKKFLHSYSPSKRISEPTTLSKSSCMI